MLFFIRVLNLYDVEGRKGKIDVFLSYVLLMIICNDCMLKGVIEMCCVFCLLGCSLVFLLCLEFNKLMFSVFVDSCVEEGKFC